MLKEDCKFELNYVQPTLLELEKIKEQNLISEIDSLNKSYKDNNTLNFLNSLNEIYLENYEALSYKKTLAQTEHSLINSLYKSRRCFSYDRIDNAEIELNLGSLKKSVNHFSETSNLYKFESQSTDYMSEKYDYENENINLKNIEYQSFNNSPFSLESKKYSFSKIPNLPPFKSILEYIISQNLIISDEVLKIILIGDKEVGKSLFFNKFYDETPLNFYEPTLSLEIKKKYVNHIGKYITMEMWDTNTHILNSEMIETYLKLSNGFILICDLGVFESITYVEKQIERLFFYSISASNIFIIANLNKTTKIKEKIIEENYIYYLNDLGKKHNIKINYINLFEIQDLNSVLEKFISGCLIRKKNFVNKLKRNSTKTSSMIENSKFNQYDKLEGSIIERDKISSPKKNKKENCLIL